MKKMNKKGFTLIEMLVVIAIIAILVAIIIPTVMSSTDKAQAATVAANLRSLKAEISTSVLTGGDWKAIKTDADKTIAYDDLAADSAMKKAVDNALDDKASTFVLTADAAGNLTVKCDDKTIAQWAAEAGESTTADG